MGRQVCSLDQSQWEVCSQDLEYPNLLNPVKEQGPRLLDLLCLSTARVPWPLLSFCVPGKVAIQKEDLQRYHNRDTWFQLQHVDADSEVQVRLAEVWGCGQLSCGLWA